jgi:Tfp pilus assembly protein FimT
MTNVERKMPVSVFQMSTGFESKRGPLGFVTRHSSLVIRHSSMRGVTFMEIMIVLLILAVFSVVAIPNMKGFHRQGKLAAAAREFALLARYARQQAVLRNHTTEILIDPEKGVYRFVAEPDEEKSYRSSRNEHSEMEQTRSLGGTQKAPIFFKLVQSATDLSDRGGSVRLLFYKNGSASAATVAVANSSGEATTIAIAGSTGAIRTYAGLPREEAVETPAPADDAGAAGEEGVRR